MKSAFTKDLMKIAIPISFQSLFQASLSIIDQIMVGKLGEEATAAVGFGGKFYGIFVFTVFSICVTASVMISQYIGSKDKKNVSNSFQLMGVISIVFSTLFTLLTLLLARPIISIYTNDELVIPLGINYLRIVAFGFIPFAIVNMISSLFRSTEHVTITVVVGIIGVILNTILNYLFIYLLDMGTDGAALATTIVTIFEAILIIICFLIYQKKDVYAITKMSVTKPFVKSALKILIPMFITELLWSIGESIYAIIYGHIGTNDSAAMMDISPLVSLSIGFFSGFAQAAGIMIGKRLGANEFDLAYKEAWKFLRIGIIGSLILGAIMIAISNPYSHLYNIQDSTRVTLIYLLIVYSLVLWTKVTNMISGKIISSGGKTKLNLIINLIGTWAIGVPLGFLLAFLFKLPIHWVYLGISIEELIRNIFCFIVIKKKIWIQNIASEKKEESLC